MTDWTVTMTLQAGEPSSPSETVSVITSGSSCVLEVSQLLPQKTITRERIPIDSDLAEKLWQTIVDERIRGWIPELKGDDVADFGEKRLSIKWGEANTTNPSVHDVSWASPLSNEKAALKVQASLKDLLRGNRQKLKASLFFF